MNVKIEESWKTLLQNEFDKPYFVSIVNQLKKEKAEGKIIYPDGKNIFNAFNITTCKDIKVVILGQDPYHGINQAHGLCFSVQLNVPPPPSLQNIYKELKLSYPQFIIPNHGNLEQWSKQGVFLLNAFLTVRANSPLSHSKIGWEIFTDAVIKLISEKNNGVVFLLWGAFAQQKAALVDANKHLILKAPHPSPLSAHRGFLGCQHFILTNKYLLQQGKSPIDWQL
ncbi:MAG: uracil-DNA glycosylase [Bacteroidota bacterium]|jgi:uracil-DNA glycosylase